MSRRVSFPFRAYLQRHVPSSDDCRHQPPQWGMSVASSTVECLPPSFRQIQQKPDRNREALAMPQGGTEL